MSITTYDNIFNILKPIEEMTKNVSGYFNFSASGKDQNLTFRLLFGRNDRGVLKYEVLEEGERQALVPESILVEGRPNCIIDKDIVAIGEQMNVLEVSKGVTDVIVAITEGMRRMEVVGPVFALNRAIDSKNTGRAEYVFGIAAYVLDDQYQYVGRLSLSVTVSKMSQLERTANLIRKAQEEREIAVLDENGLAPEKPVSGHSSMTADCRTGNNDRYKITAMIQPGSPAMEQLVRSRDTYHDGVKVTQAVGEFAELINNKLPLNNLHGMKDTSAETMVQTVATGGSYEGTIKANVPDEAEPYTLGNESVCIDPELLAILDAKAPKFNLTNAAAGLDADNLSALAEYTEQTKRLHITPDPTAELGYKLTDMHGECGVVVPVSKD